MAKYGIFVSLLAFLCTGAICQQPGNLFSGIGSAGLLFLRTDNWDYWRLQKPISIIDIPGDPTIIGATSSQFHSRLAKRSINLWETKEQTASTSGWVSGSSKNNSIKSSLLICTLTHNFSQGFGSPNDKRLLDTDNAHEGTLHLLPRRHDPPTTPPSIFYRAACNALIKKNAGKEIPPGTTATINETNYKHWWLMIMLSLAIIANILLVYKYRNQQLIRVNSLRTKISQDLHDNVGAALSSISMFCHAAIQKTDMGNLDESKKILEKIGETSRDVMKDLNESVWLINPVNDNLQKIIQRINNYALPLCTTKDIHFEVSAADSIQDLDLSVEKRKAIYLFLKEAINNCLKYAYADNLLIQFVKNRKVLLVSIKDDGIGFSAGRSFHGNGLNNMRQRSRDINGRIEFKSVNKKGTEIQLQVPLSGIGS